MTIMHLHALGTGDELTRLARAQTDQTRFRFCFLTGLKIFFLSNGSGLAPVIKTCKYLRAGT